MTEAELLVEVKNGLSIPISSTAHDAVLLQKIRAIQGFILGAGVTQEKLDTDLGTGLIVLGVSDIWNIQGGAAQLSPVFNTLLTQLAISSLPEVEEE